MPIQWSVKGLSFQITIFCFLDIVLAQIELLRFRPPRNRPFPVSVFQESGDQGSKQIKNGDDDE
jgi:hypothetical protein